MRILLVANKMLPEQDYRLAYRQLSSCAEVVFGLPGRPASLPPTAFVSFDFGEGMRWRDLLGFWALFRYLFQHRNEYDAVHFFSTKLQLFGPLVAACVGIPCLTTITGFGRVFNRQTWLYRILRWPYLMFAGQSLRFSRATFFQNRGDMKWLMQRFPRWAPNMYWVGSGVTAPIVTEKNFADGPLRVLLAARLMPDKGIPVYLECARKLQGANIQFRLAGPASDGQQHLWADILRAHELGQIHYLGELSSSQLAEEYGRCHVFVHPSRGEGMPRVMLEAGHYRLCPIASDIPAHQDLVKPGCGLIIDAGCELTSLCEALERFEQNRVECERTARQYQQQIVRTYSSRAYAERMDTLLQSLFPQSHVEAETVRIAS